MEAAGAPPGLPGLLRPGQHGKRAQLATLVARYRNQIERDLRSLLGISLQELWRERRWRELLNLINGLPGASCTQEAIATDEEFAKAVAESRGSKLAEENDGRPPLREYDHHASLLTTLIDEVRQNTIATISASLPKDAERPKFKPMPRPVSALQKALQAARLNKRMSTHDSLVRRLLGDRASKGDE